MALSVDQHVKNKPVDGEDMETGGILLQVTSMIAGDQPNCCKESHHSNHAMGCVCVCVSKR